MDFFFFRINELNTAMLSCQKKICLSSTKTKESIPDFFSHWTSSVKENYI